MYYIFFFDIDVMLQLLLNACAHYEQERKDALMIPRIPALPQKGEATI